MFIVDPLQQPGGRHDGDDGAQHGDLIRFNIAAGIDIEEQRGDDDGEQPTGFDEAVAEFAEFAGSHAGLFSERR